MNENAPNPEACEALPGHEKAFQEAIDDIDLTLETHLSKGKVDDKVLAHLRNVCSPIARCHRPSERDFQHQPRHRRGPSPRKSEPAGPEWTDLEE